MSDSNAKIKVIISQRPTLLLHILTCLPSLQTKLAREISVRGTRGCGVGVKSATGCYTVTGPTGSRLLGC